MWYWSERYIYLMASNEASVIAVRHHDECRRHVRRCGKFQKMHAVTHCHSFLLNDATSPAAIDSTGRVRCLDMEGNYK